MAHPDDRECLQGEKLESLELEVPPGGMPSRVEIFATPFKYPILARWAPDAEDPGEESRWAVATNLLTTLSPGLSEKRAKEILREIAAPSEQFSELVQVIPLPLEDSYLVVKRLPLRSRDGELDLLLARRGEFLAHPAVREANPDYLYFSFPMPKPEAEAGVPIESELERMGVLKARDGGATGSRDICVGLLDTGVDTKHEKLRMNFLRDAQKQVVGYDFVRSQSIVEDGHGHGTFCAGLIGGARFGVNQSVSIIPVRFLDSGGCGAVSDAICGIEFALSKGARVLSNSWGGAPESPDLKKKIADADRRGALFVAGAGNAPRDLDSTNYFPAKYALPNVISVGGALDSDKPAPWWGFGLERVHLTAPGQTVRSTYHYPKNAKAVMSGTSASTAFVSGACALVMAELEKEGRSWDHMDVRARIIQSVTPLQGSRGPASCCTGGRLDVYNAAFGHDLDTKLTCP